MRIKIAKKDRNTAKKRNKFYYLPPEYLPDLY
jgi:hypothetical protein